MLSWIFKKKIFKFAYLGAKNLIRGIPVKEWLACLYDKKNSATLRLTISYSSKYLIFFTDKNANNSI
jgi:hypothetical protein